MPATMPPPAPPAPAPIANGDRASAPATAPPAEAPRRGRPLLVSPRAVIAEIQAAHLEGTLFRVHRERPALYARARRLFGSWAGALRVAGFDPADVLDAARRRSVQARRARVARRAVEGGRPPAR